jgi:hypothetical protein
VRFGGFVRVMGRLKVMCVGCVRMMAGLLVGARLVMFCRLVMMPRRVLVMLGRFAMMFCCFFRHRFLLA